MSPLDSLMWCFGACLYLAMGYFITCVVMWHTRGTFDFPDDFERGSIVFLWPFLIVWAVLNTVMWMILAPIALIIKLVGLAFR